MLANISGYSTIIQLWSCVSVLCFYDSILKRLIGGKERKTMRRKLETLKSVLSLSDEDRKFFNSEIASLGNYKQTVRHIGQLTFCYTVLILSLIAERNGEVNEANELIPIFCVTAIYLIYSFASTIFTDWKYLHRPWSFVWGAIILLIATCISSPALNPQFYVDFSLSPDLLMKGVLLSLIIVPVLFIVRYYYDERYYKFALPKLTELERLYENVDRILLMPNVYLPRHERPIYSLPTDRMIVKILNEDRNLEQKQKSLSEERRKRVMMILKEHNGVSILRLIIKFISNKIYEKVIKEPHIWLITWVSLYLLYIIHLISLHIS